MAAVTAAAPSREPGWHRWAGPIDRWHDGHGWTGEYRRRPRPAKLLPAPPAPAEVELAVAEPSAPAPEPQPAPEPEPDEPARAEPEPEEQQPETDTTGTVRRLRRRRGEPLAPAGCPHTALYALGDPDMDRGRVTSLVRAVLVEMGYDANTVTSLHISRTDAGLEAQVTVLEGHPHDGTGGAVPQRTERVHLGV